MIRKVVIRNFRLFQDFELDLDPGLNVVVGDNDTGKSSLIEAINLGLTGRIGGRWLSQEFSPYLFNLDTTSEYIESLSTDSPSPPPDLIIEVYLEESDETVHLLGQNNLLDQPACGVRLRGFFSEDFVDEYQEFISDPEQVTLVPTEYYEVEWLGFHGQGIKKRNIPTVASVIDPTSIRPHASVDFHLQELIDAHLEPNERMELARQYRSLRETFGEKDSVKKINERIAGSGDESVTDRELTLGINISQRFTWESSLVTHLDRLPFQFVGKGEQSTLKTLLAIGRAADDSHIVLLEEPENHLSFSSLRQLINRVAERCESKQVVIATHSSFVLNKMGLDHLILMDPKTPTRLVDLSSSTADYFQKLAGYDTLRLVLAKKVILVEGPSEELIVQRAYHDIHGHLPIDDGTDIISVNGLAFARFLELAIALEREIVVITDNDGEPGRVETKFAEFDTREFITISYETDPDFPTLEPCILRENDLATLNLIFGKEYTTETRLLKYMERNKTQCALDIFNAEAEISMPEHIRSVLE